MEVLIIILPLSLWFTVNGVLLALATRAFKRGDNDRVLFLTTLLIGVSPFNAAYVHQRGKIYINVGDTKKALRDFDKAIRMKKGEFSFYYSLFEVLSTMKKTERFEPYAQQIVQFLPRYSESYNVRGNYLLGVERYAEALEDYKKALELYPDNPFYMNNKAWALYKLGHHGLAQQLYETILEKDSNFHQARHNLSIIAIEQLRFDDALVYANELLRRNNSSAHYNYVRSRIYRRLERYDDALTDIALAMQIAPEEASYVLERGIIYLRMGNLEQALTDCSRCIEMVPLDSCPYVDRGMVYIEMGRLDEAHTDAQKAYELEADSKYTIGLLALTSFMRADTDEAQRLWRELMQRDERYMDVEWTADDLGWKYRLVDEAKMLIATL